MTPQLQQAIKLLQMSNVELTDYIEQEIEQNPLLEREDADGGLEGAADMPSAETSVDSVDAASGAGDSDGADAGGDADGPMTRLSMIPIRFPMRRTTPRPRASVMMSGRSIPIMTTFTSLNPPPTVRPRGVKGKAKACCGTRRAAAAADSMMNSPAWRTSPQTR
jgi:hypothetical protein